MTGRAARAKAGPTAPGPEAAAATAAPAALAPAGSPRRQASPGLHRQSPRDTAGSGTAQPAGTALRPEPHAGGSPPAAALSKPAHGARGPGGNALAASAGSQLSQGRSGAEAPKPRRIASPAGAAPGAAWTLSPARSAAAQARPSTSAAASAWGAEGQVGGLSGLVTPSSNGDSLGSSHRVGSGSAAHSPPEACSPQPAPQTSAQAPPSTVPSQGLPSGAGRQPASAGPSDAAAAPGGAGSASNGVGSSMQLDEADSFDEVDEFELGPGLGGGGSLGLTMPPRRAAASRPAASRMSRQLGFSVGGAGLAAGRKPAASSARASHRPPASSSFAVDDSELDDDF